MMRDYNNKYFTIKNFIVNKSNNIVNYMILMGDYAPIPPDIVENSSGTTMVIFGTCEVLATPQQLTIMQVRMN